MATGPGKIELTIRRWRKQSSGRYFDVEIAGRIFGGRHGEAMQRPTTFQLVGRMLLIRFDGSERLALTRPSRVRIGRAGDLVIGGADDVRFGWHDYGRPRRPENWCEEIYLRPGRNVHPGGSGHGSAGLKGTPC